MRFPFLLVSGGGRGGEDQYSSINHAQNTSLFLIELLLLFSTWYMVS